MNGGSKKKTLLLALPVVLFLLCCSPLGILAAVVGDVEGCAPGEAAAVEIKKPPDKYISSTWDKAQVLNAYEVTLQAQQQGVPVQGWHVGLMTALQESILYNRANPEVPDSYKYPHDKEGYDHDSIGLFQQRPSKGWGTVKELMTPASSAEKFFTALVKVKDWEDMELTEAAQTVQHSAFPDAYAKWEDEAAHLLKVLTGKTIDELYDLAGAECGTPGAVGPEGWIAPVEAKVGSGYHTKERPDHDGVDLIAKRKTPIVAAADGVVVTSECNSTIDCRSDGDVDGDGDVDDSGCGWYVDVFHPSPNHGPGPGHPGAGTRYCHMNEKPKVDVGDKVKAGEQIGVVGSTGESSGPHLHYQVHTGLYPSEHPELSTSNSVEPVEFHKKVKAPLGGTPTLWIVVLSIL